ncbi:MAG TPA: ATP-binding protein [Capsulimonadaceae bacterium]|jgi:anti-sigma regulatory factor (Ser/Thr protein kinase)
MILRLSLDLPEDATYIHTARRLSRCLLEDINVKHGTIDDVENIVGEVCSNVIRHAESKAAHFLVTLEYYEPKVVITVKDTGKGFVMDDVLPVGQTRSDGLTGERLGGYGMVMLEGLADKLQFSVTEPQGTTVRVEKNLEYKTAVDARHAAALDHAKSIKVIATTQ